MLELWLGLKQQVRRGKIEKESLWDPHEMWAEGAGRLCKCSVAEMGMRWGFAFIGEEEVVKGFC